MSDYISKSAMAKAIENHYNGLTYENVPQSIPDFYSQMAQLVENQPTISETEIIRKAFERVVERLEERRDTIYPWDEFETKNHLRLQNEELDIHINIVKEEGGIE